MTGLHLDICLAYLDDIIVFSRSTEEHLDRLEVVFQRLEKAGLKIKPAKCSFFCCSVSFLGHVVSERGIETSPEKTQAVVDWPVPTSVTEVRSFIGLVSYYCRFLKDFSKIAAPLNALMRKDKKFEWDDEAQESFESLKRALTSPPVLAMPQDDGLFTLDTDASEESIGAILSQEQNGTERVIAYASKSLDKCERNYCVTRKGLLAVVYFLRHFKQYLLGRQIRVRTDHAALTWLRKTPEPIGQQARWLEIMEEFDFTVEHRPGVRHSNADAMSRRPCPKKDCFCSQQISVHSDEEPGRPSLAPRSPRDQHVNSTSRIEESLKGRPPDPTLYGPAGRPPARPSSTEVKSEVSSQRDRALLSRSTRTGCRCQGGDGPCNRPPTRRLNGPADRPVIGRRRRKCRRSQAPRLETILEVDEAPYREALSQGSYVKRDSFDFSEEQACEAVPFEALLDTTEELLEEYKWDQEAKDDVLSEMRRDVECKVPEERDLIDFSEDVSNEERDLIDFSEE